MGAEIVEARLHTNWMDNGYPGSGFKGGLLSNTFTTFDKTFAGLQTHNINKIDPTYVRHTYHFIYCNYR